MPHFVRSSIGRKLVLSAGLPTLAASLAAAAWLGAGRRGPAPWRAILAGLPLLAAAGVALHLLAVRRVVNAPLARMRAALRRAQENGFLLRVPVESEDELGELARSFNGALATITDLHARRIEDEHSLQSLQRELALKAELESQHRLLDAAHHALEGRLRELTLLGVLARAFNATLELEPLLAAISDGVGRTLGYRSFALMLLDEGTRELVVQSVFGVDPGVRGVRVALGQGLAGAAATLREVVHVPDTRVDTRFPVHRWTGGQHGSVVAVPMLCGGACVGALDVFRPERDGFAPDEIRFLESVASQAAMAIANARLHQRTVALSLTDPLTGLHNRRSLFARLEMELTRAERFAQPFSVALLDLDGFEELVGAAGHAAGDATLRAVAGVVAGALRKVDVAARYFGEEFALLLPGADPAAARETAEKLRALVAATPFEHGGALPGGRVTISVGVASHPRDAHELEALVDCADAALFAARRRGRDTVVASEPGMREAPGRRRDVRTTARVEPG